MYKIRKIVFHEHPVLKNLSLNFCDSEGKCIDTIIFAGENGTGKSTIINSIYMLVSRTANFEADVEFEKDGNPFQITYEYTIVEFQKMDFCEYICSLDSDPLKAIFANLKKIIDMLATLFQNT